MKLCCSSPMVPADSLTEKAELLTTWGYDAIAVFQPLEDWNDEVRRRTRRRWRARTGVPPGRVRPDRRHLRPRHVRGPGPAGAVPRDVPRGRRGLRRARDGDRDRVPVRRRRTRCRCSTRTSSSTPAQNEEFLDFYREMLGGGRGSEGRVLLEPINRYESRYLNLVVRQPRDHRRRSPTRTPGCSPTPSTCRSRRPTSPRPPRCRGPGRARPPRRQQPAPARVTAASTGRRSSARSTRSGYEGCRQPRVLDRGRPGRRPCPRRPSVLRALIGA